MKNEVDKPMSYTAFIINVEFCYNYYELNEQIHKS